MLRPFRRLLRTVLADRSGAAFVELALVAPVLVVFYCGSYVVSDMVTCGRKVSLAARTITDLTTRYGAVTSTDVTAVLSNSALVLAPYSSSTAAMRVSEVQVTDASHAKVVWSKAQNGAALTVGTTINLPANLAPPLMQPDTTVTPNKPGAYFILGEVNYPYTPLFGGAILPSPTLYDRYFMLPRLSDQVPLQ